MSIPHTWFERYHALAELTFALDHRFLTVPFLPGDEDSPLMSSSVTIGSRPDCDLVVDVPSVSGRHCRLIRKETGLVLEDLNSTNGTFLNGERIRARFLSCSPRPTRFVWEATPWLWSGCSH